MDSLLVLNKRDKWGQTTFRKHSENVVCPLFISIYFPLGTDPSAPGSTYIRLMPAGSTPVPGLENGYWISVKNGQPINPATGGTGTRGHTYVPLAPDTFPPKR